MASREKTQTSHITLYKKNHFLEIIELPANRTYGRIKKNYNTLPLSKNAIFFMMFYSSRGDCHPQYGCFFWKKSKLPLIPLPSLVLEFFIADFFVNTRK